MPQMMFVHISLMDIGINAVGGHLQFENFLTP
jgi:hypothetical protein